MTDVINRPSHYTEGRDIEPIDVIDDWNLGFYEGQVLKYVSRAGRKDDRLQDLRKAKFYLDRLIDNEQCKEPPTSTADRLIKPTEFKIVYPAGLGEWKAYIPERAWIDGTDRVKDMKPASSYKVPDECQCDGCINFRSRTAEGDDARGGQFD